MAAILSSSVETTATENDTANGSLVTGYSDASTGASGSIAISDIHRFPLEFVRFRGFRVRSVLASLSHHSRKNLDQKAERSTSPPVPKNTL